MKDIEKEIDSLIAKRSNFTTILIVLATGIMGVTLNFKFAYLIPVIAGVGLFIFFMNAMLNTDEQINCLTKELKK